MASFIEGEGAGVYLGGFIFNFETLVRDLYLQS
jgi:hypothetical protein